MIVSGKMGSYSREGLCLLIPLRALCHFDSRITAFLGWEQCGPMTGGCLVLNGHPNHDDTFLRLLLSLRLESG